MRDYAAAAGTGMALTPVPLIDVAAHIAHLAQIVEAARAMHGGAIVPHHQIVRAPGMGIDEAGLRRVLHEVADEGARLGCGPANDATDMRRQVKRMSVQ